MANICWFKGIVKGPKLNCEAFLEVFPCNDIDSSKASGFIDDYTIVFCGTCKWKICAYAKNESQVKKLRENDMVKICNGEVDDYTNYRLIDLTTLFGVEVLINSIDEDLKTEFLHYKKNKEVNILMPDYLSISENEIDEGLSIDNVSVHDNKVKKTIIDRKEAIKVVKQNGDNLAFLSEDLRNDEEIVTMAMEGSLSFQDYKYIGSELLNNKQFMLYAVSKYGLLLKYAGEEIKKDRKVVKAAAKESGGALRYADEELKNDKELALMAVKAGEVNPEDEECYGKKLLNDKDFVLEAVKINSFFFYGICHENMRRDKDVALAAAKGWAVNLKLIDEELFKDHDFVNELKAFYTDKKNVIRQIKDEGYYDLVEHGLISDELFNDKEVIMTAFQENEYDIDMNDKRMIVQAINLSNKRDFKRIMDALETADRSNVALISDPEVIQAIEDKKKEFS